ncbi:MAG TPA: DinB family protein [Bryobacteraceae bacterium]|nr:DinB family protein [Bryobacteraceae bacterium]
MIPMFQSLWTHLVWADHAILKTVSGQEGAAADSEIRKWLHHIVTVQQFFLALFQGQPFDMERFRREPGGMDELGQLFEAAHADGAAFTSHLDDAALARTIEFPVPAFKDFHPSVRDGLMQVIMHSEHHRAQVSQRVRALGGKPPVLDYIAWIRDNSLK